MGLFEVVEYLPRCISLQKITIWPFFITQELWITVLHIWKGSWAAEESNKTAVMRTIQLPIGTNYFGVIFVSTVGEQVKHHYHTSLHIFFIQMENSKNRNTTDTDTISNPTFPYRVPSLIFDMEAYSFEIPHHVWEKFTFNRPYISLALGKPTSWKPTQANRPLILLWKQTSREGLKSRHWTLTICAFTGTSVANI